MYCSTHYGSLFLGGVVAMLVRARQELRGHGRELEVFGGRVRSGRFLTKADGLGFSLNDVRVSAGQELSLWYKNHWEANYVIAGAGTVEETGSGAITVLSPGVIYTVGPRDRHVFRSETDVHVVSIFAPSLQGDECHDKDGAYIPSGDLPPRTGTMFVKRLDDLRAAGEEKIVANGGARTVRVLCQRDELGFSLSDVHVAAGRSNDLWYKNHWEVNYVLDGRAKITDLKTDEVTSIDQWFLYVVGPDDPHRFEALTDVHVISLFDPPLTGEEVHNADGVLPGSGPIPKGPY